MISEEIRAFIESAGTAVIASADRNGQPHLALGTVGTVSEERLIFENWLCYQTLDNVRVNPKVVVAVISQGKRIGYQFSGKVVDTFEIAIMDGFQPGAKPSGEPQTMSRLVILVEKITAFCEGLHVDRQE